MATKKKQQTKMAEEALPQSRNIFVEIEKGSVSVARDDLNFTISGKNVSLTKQSPLHLSLDTGEIDYDDGETQVKVEGDAIKLKLD